MKSNTKKIAPIQLEVETFQKLQKIIAKYSDDDAKFVSVREALVNLIDEKYEQISGSIRW